MLDIDPRIFSINRPSLQQYKAFVQRDFIIETYHSSAGEMVSRGLTSQDLDQPHRSPEVCTPIWFGEFQICRQTVLHARLPAGFDKFRS